MSASRYYARRPVPEYGGQPLDEGQILTLGGFVNDEKLVRLGYFQPFTGGDTRRCRVCGHEFINEGARARHGDYRHVDRELSPAEAEAREESRMADAPPPFLDKTTASLEAKPGPIEVSSKKGKGRRSSTKRAAAKEA